MKKVFEFIFPKNLIKTTHGKMKIRKNDYNIIEFSVPVINPILKLCLYAFAAFAIIYIQVLAVENQFLSGDIFIKTFAASIIILLVGFVKFIASVFKRIHSIVFDLSKKNVYFNNLNRNFIAGMTLEELEMSINPDNNIQEIYIQSISEKINFVVFLKSSDSEQKQIFSTITNTYYKKKEKIDNIEISNNPIKSSNSNIIETIHKINSLIYRESHKGALKKSSISELINYLNNLYTSKEEYVNLIKEYHLKSGSNLINDLAELSSSYDSIKNIVEVFIKFKIVEPNYPHKLI